jgi:glycosyltransferase involved in cell wall biosynthesis
MHEQVTFDGRHVVFFSWRDTRNPEAGGAELYLEKMARGLVERGARVTIFCAAHDRAPADEVVDGIRFVRRGSKVTVYARGVLALLTRRFGRLDVVVDVQNGLPFFTCLATRRPGVVLVHHVHREQWPVVYPGLMGRVGWWIESRFAPRLYRRCQYVAVSQATRAELVTLGVAGNRIAVVHNGSDPAPAPGVPKSATPTICTVGRLVPHKQVEHAIEACLRLRAELPDVRLTVAGSGWWEDRLADYSREVGAEGSVRFEGHVTEARRSEIYAESWVMALPSLKEGWGLVVGEAGTYGTPTVAYRSAGGTTESIEEGQSGLLADDFDEFVAELRSVLTDQGRREKLSAGAQDMSHRFTWGHAQGSFAQVITAAMTGVTLSAQDPDEDA